MLLRKGLILFVMFIVAYCFIVHVHCSYSIVNLYRLVSIYCNIYRLLVLF